MSNFLFRPISNAISRTLSAATRSPPTEKELKDTVVEDTVVEDGEKTSASAARAVAVDATTNTVSPPADESPTDGLEEKPTDETQVVDNVQVASIPAIADAPVEQEELPSPPKKRRRHQSELEKLKCWGEQQGGGMDETMEDTESACHSRQIGKFQGDISLSKLAVTPSPRRRRTKKAAPSTLDTRLALGDQENVARLPRKRNRLTTSKRIGAAPRRTMPRRQATLHPADESFVSEMDKEEDTKPAAVQKSPKRRRKASARLQVKLSSDEEEEEESEEEESSDESEQLSCDEEALYESDGDDISDDSLSGDELKMKELAGEWSDIEKLFFLYGLKVHGKGKWSKISTHVRSRSTVQVKSYGQRFVRRKENRKGDMFAPLKGKEIIVEALSKEEQKSGTPWSDGENLLFLYGLKKLGKGKWQEMHNRFLHSRDRHQIRNHHRKSLHAAGEGKLFTPLKKYNHLITRLVEERDAVMIPVPTSTDDEDGVSVESEPEGTEIKPKPTDKSKVQKLATSVEVSYDADTVERLALAEVASSSPEAAFRFCIGILKFWYAEVEELLEHYNEGVTPDFVSLRDGIANLWCVLVRLTTSVLEPPKTQVQGQQKKMEANRVATILLDIARSCPFVGNHHKVVQARVNLEVDEYALSGDEGITEVVKNANVRGENALKALSFSIDICNDAVRKSPLCNVLSLNVLEDEVSGVAGQYCPWMSASVMKLGECVSFIRSLWHFPEHIVMDRTSATTLTREANRLSRMKEALLKSGVSFDLDTEYGCDCGCWSVFGNKLELVEHQKTCRGQAIASGEHEKFAWKKINDWCSTRSNVGNGTLYNQMHSLQKLESESMNSARGAKRWNVPRLNCWEVEYGCGRGCSCVFATKQELLDHQSNCEEYSSSCGSGPPKKASVSSLMNASVKSNGRPAQLTVEE